MRAMIEMGNGTTITVDGTAEEISDCYVQMLQGIIELNEWYRDEHGEPDDEDEHGERGDEYEPVMEVQTDDDAVDKLLDYISMTRGLQTEAIIDEVFKQDKGDRP